MLDKQAKWIFYGTDHEFESNTGFDLLKNLACMKHSEIICNKYAQYFL